MILPSYLSIFSKISFLAGFTPIDFILPVLLWNKAKHPPLPQRILHWFIAIAYGGVAVLGDDFAPSSVAVRMICSSLVLIFNCCREASWFYLICRSYWSNLLHPRSCQNLQCKEPCHWSSLSLCKSYLIHSVMSCLRILQGMLFMQHFVLGKQAIIQSSFGSAGLCKSLGMQFGLFLRTSCRVCLCKRREDL